MKKYLPGRDTNWGPFYQLSSTLPTELHKPGCLRRWKFVYIAVDIGPVLVETCFSRRSPINLPRLRFFLILSRGARVWVSRLVYGFPLRLEAGWDETGDERGRFEARARFDAKERGSRNVSGFKQQLNRLTRARITIGPHFSDFAPFWVFVIKLKPWTSLKNILINSIELLKIFLSFSVALICDFFESLISTLT